MTSKIKVDNINKVSDDSNIIKKCGTTTTIGSGASNPIVVDGSAVTLGRCGGTVALASGATQTGFGRTGTVDWQTTPKTATFTAVSGEGYFANTTGSSFTMNLPAGSAGAIVSVQDYLNTFTSNNLIVSPNGSEKINGSAGTINLNTNGEGLTLVYVDGTIGWRSIVQSEFTDAGFSLISATGGTVLTVGDYKTHVFTGPGTFCVASGNDTVDYFVVAGGGGTGGNACQTGAGGAGGFRVSNRCGSCISGPLMSPLANPTGIPISSGPYAVTVGAGGAPVPISGSPAANPGSNSIFSSITSAGGGGGRGSPTAVGDTGGSGGGSQNGAGASGNTPPVSPPQGNAGGSGNRCSPQYGSGGGGGAGGAGTGGTSSNAGPGGIGSFISDTFIGPTAPSYGTPGPESSTRYFAGGGGGSAESTAGNGGAGGGGDGITNTTPTANAGSTNTGGGAGSGNDAAGAQAGAAGGSGIVMIRYKFQ